MRFLHTLGTILAFQFISLTVHSQVFGKGTKLFCIGIGLGNCCLTASCRKIEPPLRENFESENADNPAWGLLGKDLVFRVYR
jgi:hypothetical protein